MARRRRCCQIASASASSARLLMPRALSKLASVATTSSPAAGCDLDDVGQIIFALGVAIADLLKQRQRMLAGNRHQAAIAEFDPLLGFRGVLVLADRDKLSILLDQPAVAGRIGRAEADDDDRGTFRELLSCGRQRVGLDQRRVAEHHQDVVIAARDGAAGGQHRMSGAKPLFLHEDFRRRRQAGDGLADVFRAVADDQRQIGPARSLSGRGDMRDHRQARDLVQDLRLGALHARALAGGEDDRQAGSRCHVMATIGRGGSGVAASLALARSSINAVKFR